MYGEPNIQKVFRPISGHLKIRDWSFKHTEGEIYMLFLPQYVICESEDCLKCF
jgi:hypothetical protein